MVILNFKRNMSYVFCLPAVDWVLDNITHWYPLRERDVTTGVELPKPTILPADIREASEMNRRGSPNLYCSSQGSPKPNRQKVLQCIIK